jgi:hypothetical protein
MRPETRANAGIQRPSTPAAPCAQAFHRLPAAQQRMNRCAHRPTLGIAGMRGSDSASARAVCECRPRIVVARPTSRTPRTSRHVARPSQGARRQVAAAQLEAISSQRLGPGLALDLFLEALQQAVADAQHQRGAAIEALHHLLDGEAVGVVDVPQRAASDFW